MSDPIRIRAKNIGELTEVQVLMPHPMETGLRKDDSGAYVAAHYITGLRVVVGERPVFEARLSQAVSKDPLIGFRFRGGRPGDRITVSWTDSRGDQRSDHTLIG
jgi:sulfur-oxidizing protein SoxZ